MAAMNGYHQSTHFSLSPDYPQMYGNAQTGHGSTQSRQHYYNTWSAATARQEKKNLEYLGYWHQPTTYLPAAPAVQAAGSRSISHAGIGAPTMSHAAYTGFPATGFVPSQPYQPSPQPTQTSQVENQQQFLQPTQSENRKEEKPTGGVSAHLDYEINQMTEYVAEMAQRAVLGSGSVSPTFRKFVSQILSATRLPSSTILLALHYLAVKVDLVNQEPPQKHAPDHMYRMLTTALLLGSKFLDDNTFQNRSWSEVTGIPVVELNKMEREWLQAIQWNLHIDVNEQFGFNAWSQNWKTWQAERYRQPAKKFAGLSPIETNLQSQTRSRKHVSPLPSQRQTFSRSITPTHSHTSYRTPSQYDPNWLYPGSAHDNSPPSAPETGPSTPEYLGLGSSWFSVGPQQQYNVKQLPQHGQNLVLPSNQQSCSYAQMPYSVPSYTDTTWRQHPPGCRCEFCWKTIGGYVLPSIYGQPAVVG